MAVIYDAQLSPSKSELLAQWLPSQTWFRGDASTVVRLGAFRFDDPAGEVGIETHVLAVDGVTYQVPLTYRGAPLEGAESFLVTTMEHSVLGKRWVYDATGDPVYLHELAAAVLAGKPQAPERLVVGDSFEALPLTVAVTSSGISGETLPELRFEAPQTAAGVTTIPAGPVNFAVMRELDITGTQQAGPTLTARWDGQEEPVVVAAAIIV
ncbi:CG0192-related protein [Arthrobacter sp. Sr24]